MTINKYIVFIILFLTTKCTINPDSYKERLSEGTWINIESIKTGAGTENIVNTSDFSSEGIYTLNINHPVNGISENKYFYSVGFYNPKFAIVLYEYNEGNIGANPPTVGTPIFYYFENNFSTLVTSTNAGMSLRKKWTH